MKLLALGLLSVAVAGSAQLREGRPQGFRPNFEDESPAPSLLHITKQQNTQYRTQEPPRQRLQDYQGKRPPLKLQNLKEEELEEEEKEEPDRLTLLLPESKFNCEGKGTGYYADEGLGCEVFHYCQDNARHSWICPEGFVFHQVHLICMPPSSDNICSQSSQFHFVNEYLYKPINEDEVQRKPNVTLRYSERYYPDVFYREEDVNEQRLRNQVLPTPQSTKGSPRVQQATPTPVVYRQPANNQVFHSPEEVNIPLQHRRPLQPTRNYQLSTEEYEY